MRNIFKTLLLMSMVLIAAAVQAADVQMRIEPALISLLDRAVLKIEFIDTKGDAPRIPRIDGLNIQYQGQSSQTQIVNFNSTSKIIHTYVITPSKVGDFTIGPITAKYKGGKKNLSAQLRVIKPSDDKEAQQISEIMFCRIATAREKPYVHEPFELEMRAYIRDGVQINERSFQLRGGIPENGIEGEIDWNLAGRAREERNGTIFNVYVFRANATTLTAGNFTFNPVLQVGVVVPRQRRRSFGFDDPFFGDFFGRQETRQIALESNLLEVDVQPVPTQNRPNGYTGGVGRFDIEIDVGPTSVKAGEPITIKTRVFGKGNVKQITPPEIETNHELKLYEARTIPSENDNEIRFEQVVIPKSDNVKEIPAINFTYFNTQTADFRTLTKGPFPVTVEAGANPGAQMIATLPPSAGPQETRILGRDIIYLKPQPKKWRHTSDAQWHQSTALRILLPLPALLLGIVGISALRRDRLAGNQALARRQQAPKAARSGIQRAEQALKQKDEHAFHEALWNALADYFGNRLNLAPGDVTLQTLQARIPELAEEAAPLFNTVEQRRYGMGGSATPEEMKTLLKQLNDLLKKSERIKL